MTRQRMTLLGFIAVQVIAVAVVAVSLAAVGKNGLQLSTAGRTTSNNWATVSIDRAHPFQVTPLYDDAEIVSDAELAAVLERIRPRFPRAGLKPNHVEHAVSLPHLLIPLCSLVPSCANF